MAWYGEKAVYETTKDSIVMKIVPVKKFKNFDEAFEWFDKNDEYPISIWFNRSDGDKNDDISKQLKYESRTFDIFITYEIKFQNFRMELSNRIGKLLK